VSCSRKASPGQPVLDSVGWNTRVYQSSRRTFSLCRSLLPGRGTVSAHISHRAASGGQQAGHVRAKRTYRPFERASPDRAAGPSPGRTEQTPDLHTFVWRQVYAQRTSVQPVARFETASSRR
jgi:hypothetical protein